MKHKKEILSEWVKNCPCTRPFVFWLFAEEHRREINGKEIEWRGKALDRGGLPKYWDISWDPADPPCFESEAAYLERHGLLTATEKRHLEQYPDLMGADEVVFEED